MNETDSLYLIAIEKYSVEIDSFYSKYYQPKFPKTIYIQYEDYLSKIPDSVNGYKIQTIGFGNRIEHFRENNNELRLVKIFPLTLKDKRFSITLTPYVAELKKQKHLNLGLSDWTIVFFNFRNGKLIYDKTENGGI